jgi:2,3-bisphosphoglycerate-independent phosphoglycerate mutase
VLAARPALDTLTTTWAGRRRPLPSFAERAGLRGAMVTSSALYRGYAALLGLEAVHVDTGDDPGADLATRLAAAARLVEAGAAFVHVHTKVLDEAGHTKYPDAKRRVLEALDPAFAALERPPLSGAVVAVTGDHATPSRDDVLHTGDPSPLVLAGPGVAADPVEAFGEAPAAAGRLGTLRAADVLPVLLSWANRPRFLGARTSPHDTLAVPNAVEAMPPD